MQMNNASEQNRMKPVRFLMKLIKAGLKHIFTLPQVIVHKIKGVTIPYVQQVTFFRYFPFGKINTDSTVDIKYRKKAVKFYFGRLGPMAAGEFAQRDYDGLPVEGYTVVDIGAAVGDTAIIFALRGAKKVVGYELNKRYFEMAMRNIKLNNLENIIYPINAGLYKETGKIRFTNNNPRSAAVSRIIES